MRTTLNLPDGLYDEIRARATASGRTTTSLVVEALRSFLSQPERVGPVRALPSYGRPDDRFLVDLADRDALWAALDERP